MRHTSGIFPDPDDRRVTGIPKPLTSQRERGTDYGQPRRETTVANVSRNKQHPFMKADRAGKLPRGV